MFGAETDADQARAHAARQRCVLQQTDWPGEALGRPTESSSDLLAHQLLHALREAGREFAAMLDTRQIANADGAFPEGFGKNIGGRDSVLNGQIDSYTADRRHGVCCVADTNEARPIPLAQAVDLDGEELHVVPVAQLTEAVAEKGSKLRDIRAEMLRCLWRAVPPRCPWGTEARIASSCHD